MSRSRPIRYEEVARCASQRLAQRQKLSIDAIHSDLGNRGSRNTIGKFLRQWRAAHDDHQPDDAALTSTAMPPQVRFFFEEVWDFAWSEAKQSMVQKVEQLESENKELRSEKESMEAEIARLRAELLQEKARNRAPKDSPEQSSGPGL